MKKLLIALLALLVLTQPTFQSNQITDTSLEDFEP